MIISNNNTLIFSLIKDRILFHILQLLKFKINITKIAHACKM